MVRRIVIDQIEQGMLWQTHEEIPAGAVADLLEAKNQLAVLRHGRPPYQVVLGVPHQVPTGVWQICEERRDENGQINARKGDDNVASFGLVIFSRLVAQQIPCKLVIMSRASTHDPNKVPDSPYCQEVFSEITELLFECHASNGRRLLDLELSAGSNRLTQTVHFGQSLAGHLAYRYQLGVQMQPGRKQALIFRRKNEIISGSLQLPATKTISLRLAEKYGVPALHLEAKPLFRGRSIVPHAVSADGQILGRAIAKTIVSLRGQIKLDLSAQ